MKLFDGFQAGKTRSTPLPNPFFTDLLPYIDHVGELKLTLHAFFRLSLKEGQVRYLRRKELLADDILLDGLARHRHQAEAALDEALERAVERQTFLHVEIEGAQGAEDYYFVNTPKGRAAFDGILRGEWRPTQDLDAPINVAIDRPNIFTLYEQNIGPLTPMIAEELRDAEQIYPIGWIEEGIRLAVQNNARSWRYVLAIIDRWQTEGKKDDGRHQGDSEKARSRYLDYQDE